MSLNNYIRSGFVAFALCVAASGYATQRPVVSVGAPQEMQLLGTITVMPERNDAADIVYSETQGKGIVSVGEPITLGPAQPQKLVAMR
jgi:hypothetical protein